MKSTNILALFLISLLLGMDANAAGSLLRIACDGDDIGAEVFINNKFKGECPIDIQVSEGMQKIRVVKAINATYEKTFNQEIRIGDGTVKKVEVVLSAPQLNAKEQLKENERIRQYQAELAKEERRNKEILLKQQKAAESGDIAAMIALGDKYANENELDKNESNAAIWYDKAMSLGDNTAGVKLSTLYVKKPSLIGELSYQDERIVNIKGEKNIHTFVQIDPFFKVPGGNEKHLWTEYRPYLNNTRTMINKIACSREEGFFQVVTESESSDYSGTGKSIGVLGGLISVKAESNSGFLSPSFDTEMISIEKLYGQPFPLKPGKRFGIQYTASVKHMGYQSNVAISLNCGIISDSLNKQSLICMPTYDAVPTRHNWHEASGCFNGQIIK